MKSLVKILFVSCVASLTAAAQTNFWEPVQAGNFTPVQTVISIAAVDSSVIWAAVDTNYFGAPVPANHLPKFLRTTDGGTTWFSGPIDTGLADLRGHLIWDISARDGSTAWIATNRLGGGPGGIYKTVDGGQTWLLQREAASVWVYFFDQLHGVSVNLGQIYATSDGGTTWESALTVPTFDPGEYNIIFSGNNSQARHGDTVWNGTSKGRVYRSTNRGVDWTIYQTSLGRNACINSLAFQDGRNGLAVSCLDSMIQNASNRIGRTTDGGLTWTEIAAPSSPRAEKVAYVPGTSGVFVLASSSSFNPGSAYTTDFGATWTAIDYVRYQSVAFAGPNNGWSGGLTTFHPGAMYRWNGTVLTGIDDVRSKPEGFTLSQNYPNPFNPSTTIKFSLLDVGTRHVVSLRVYNVLGQEVATLVNEEMKPGTYRVEWNATGVASGVYLYRLRAGSFTETRKLLLLR